MGRERLFLPVEGLEARRSREGLPSVYYDSLRRGGRADYVELVRELHQRNMVEYPRKREERVGIFSLFLQREAKYV